jgi:thiamine-monophosphate kinase
VLPLGGETLILTHDMMVEGTHFLPAQDMADVAWKLVAVNLSDLAAKGAEPVGVMLGYMLGGDDERFAAGLHEACDAFDVPLLGGDTVRGSGPRSFGLTAVGRATHTPVPDRRGACAGDAIYVTGTLGAAMLGFEALNDSNGRAGMGADTMPYRRPRPLLAEGRALAPLVSAMMDVSDGLLLDCWRMAWASHATFQLESEAFPVADPARQNECVRWGDDYQLLFTAPPGTRLPVAATRIGTVQDEDIAALWVDSHVLTPADGLGYQH